MRRVLRAAAPALSLAALVGAWWAAVTLAGVPELFLPAPPAVLAALTTNAGYLAGELTVTLAATLAGFVLAVITGCVVGGIVGVTRGAERVLLPPLVALNAVPKVAVAPLLVLWLGFGPAPKITLVWLVCAFPVILGVVAGLRSTPAELIDLTASLCASRWQTLVRVRAPWAAPAAFTGLRLSAQLAVIGAVVAEVTAPDRGLGALIVTAATTADTPLAFAAVGLLSALNVTLYYTVAGVERVVLPWARAVTA